MPNNWILGQVAGIATDHLLLKFTAGGKFLMQIGKPGLSLGSNAPDQLGRPTWKWMPLPTKSMLPMAASTG